MAMYFPKVKTDRLPFRVPQYCELYVKYSLHWLSSFVFLFIYIIVMKHLYVPSYSYFNPNHGETFNVTCDTRGDLTEACNAARQVDLWIMGWDHMYTTPEYTRSASCQVYPTYSDCPLPMNEAAPWCFVPMDPEGILASLPTVLTTFLGFHFGNVLIHFKGHRERLLQWIPLSLSLFVTGLAIHYGGWKMNKQLWSPSYLFFMAGSTGILLTIFYVLMDFRKWQPEWMSRPWKLTNVFIPFMWVGLNTFFVYIMAAADVFDSVVEWFYYNNAGTDNLVALSFNHIFCNNPSPAPVDDDDNTKCIMFDQTSKCHGGIFDGQYVRYAGTVFVIFRVLFWIVIAGGLHKIKWYWVL